MPELTIQTNQAIVDVHAHVWDCHERVVLAEIDSERAPRLATEVRRRLEFYPETSEITTRLAALDVVGIDVQFLSFLSPHSPNVAITPSLCSRANDLLAEFVAQAPDRLGAFARLDMNDMRTAIAEMERAVKVLGLSGVYLPTDFALDAPRTEAFYSAIEELDVPLLLHGPVPGGATLFRDNRLSYRSDLIGDELTGRYHLGAPLITVYEETLAALVLIMSGILERHPGLRVCIAHGGGLLAEAVPRVIAGLAVHGSTAGILRDPNAFETQLSRLWFDSDIQSSRSIQFATDVLGVKNFVLGTDFPGWGPHPLHYVAPELQRQFAANVPALFRGTAG